MISWTGRTGGVEQVVASTGDAVEGWFVDQTWHSEASPDRLQQSEASSATEIALQETSVNTTGAELQPL